MKIQLWSLPKNPYVENRLTYGQESPNVVVHNKEISTKQFVLFHKWKL
jgi:hypothetical protein